MLLSQMNDTCYQRWLITRDQVQKSYNTLVEYVLNETMKGDAERKGNFLAYCEWEACFKALDRLVSMLTGTSPSDCPIIESIHWGNPMEGFPRGQSDLIATQGAYVLTLLQWAISV
jgi:hypothetical protein